MVSVSRPDPLHRALIYSAALIIGLVGAAYVTRPQVRVERVEVPVKGEVQIIREAAPRKGRAMLDQVRQDWGMKGRLDCRVVQ
jgi:hypothetical protein